MDQGVLKTTSSFWKGGSQIGNQTHFSLIQRNSGSIWSNIPLIITPSKSGAKLWLTGLLASLVSCGNVGIMEAGSLDFEFRWMLLNPFEGFIVCNCLEQSQPEALFNMSACQNSVKIVDFNPTRWIFARKEQRDSLLPSSFTYRIETGSRLQTTLHCSMTLLAFQKNTIHITPEPYC